MSRIFRKWLIYIVLAISVVWLLYRYHAPCVEVMRQSAVMVPHQTVIYGKDTKQYVYGRAAPFIFIGGVPRSGTTLIRAMLDAHPDIRCGEETRVIPRVLQLRYNMMKSTKEVTRLEEAGITNEVLDSAISAFIMEVIAKHGDPAPKLCNKDPFTLKSAVYLGSLFPNAKFVWMVRDGRAVIHSVITRQVTISGFDLTNFKQCLMKWNSISQAMNEQCLALGNRCLRVYYEQLVLHPKEWMEKILKFLEVPWNDSVLHHEMFIDQPGGVSLSKVERSTDQVIKPVNVEALSKWVGHVPQDVLQHMDDIAPMLKTLGYDPNANPPNYGIPDSFVADNTKDIELNRDVWQKKAAQVLQKSKKDITATNPNKENQAAS
ncbi:Protein-tyrosine sulfotransferase [Chamberlinius hualienensis]